MKKNTIIQLWKDTKNIVSSTILCIRFPFLYPRNRWTGKHYNNWKIEEKQRDIHALYHVTNWTKPGSLIDRYNGKKYYYDKKVFDDGTYIEQYWKNWWSKYYYKMFNYIKKFLFIFHCLPTYTELGHMEDGWRNAFGIQMCKEIKKELKKYNVLYKYRITDIKEKYGYLHWYDNGWYGSKESRIPAIINKYADISLHTCIDCGKPATCYTNGYVSPYCDECARKQPYTTEKNYEDVKLF